MKKYLILSCLILMLFSCVKVEQVEKRKEISKSPFEIMYLQRAYPTGQIKANAAEEARTWKTKKQERLTRSLEGTWELAGPTNVGGRVTDIEIPVDQAETYYVGSASGGIFKSTDAGDTWNPIFDGIGALAIGDIAVSKQNTDIVWVGTGEENPGGGSLAYEGDGIYRSDDGGESWINRGLENTGSISHILIDPNDDEVIFASAMGRLFSNENSGGIYRSQNNGDTWEQVFFVSDSTGVIDMAMHPTQSNILYAASWERIRTRQDRQYGGATTGLFRSIDGGDTWQELTNGLPSAPSQKGRIGFDISQSNPQVLYARYADTAGAVQGIFRSNDGGDSWTPVNSGAITNVGFHWWFEGIHIDPTDENILYNVDFLVQKSVNGGASWDFAFPGVHVDQHALAFNPMVPNQVILGNDGGIDISSDAGESSIKTDGLPITQFYRFFVDPNDENRIFGGSQDNGTIRTSTGGQDDWSEFFGGDGFQTLVDNRDGNVVYALSQRGNLAKTSNGGASFVSATNGIAQNDRNNWDTPIVFDPENNNTIYYGTNRVWRSTNGSLTWSPVSPDLTDGAAPGILNFGTITSIDVSPLDSDIVIAGTDDSNIWITVDGGQNWENVSNGLPELWTTKVLADPDDSNSFFVTFSGYRYGNNLGHVFHTTDGGESWIDIGTSLPDIPVNDIVKVSQSSLYIATDVGVMTSEDVGQTWIPFGENLPDVVVTDLHIHEASRQLFAATYGRSAFSIDISDIFVSTAETTQDISLKVFPNPASERVTISHDGQWKDASVSLYDAVGKSVYTARFTSNTLDINIGHLAKGVYFVKVQDGKKETTIKLIVR